MTWPDDKRKGSPRERFRNILAADEDAQPVRETRKPATVNLPKVVEDSAREASTESTRRAARSTTPDIPNTPPLLRVFWTVGGILSVVANLVLLSMLLARPRFPAAAGAPDMLIGVYTSLEQLGNAHIRTTIPVQASLALDAAVPVSTSTRITLANDVFIPGAHVRINSSGLSIDSPADITLPAGTQMDVNLDMELPLRSALPVTAEVPVDIAIRDTELHAAIQGLKEALQPMVCASEPAAVLSDGSPICR